MRLPSLAASPRIRRSLPWLLGILSVAAGLAAWALWGPTAPIGRPPIILSMAPIDAWEGVNPLQRHGLLILLKDHLEVIHGQTVVEEPNLADTENASAHRVVLAARRSGHLLRLELRVVRAGRQEMHWVSELGDPRAVMAAGLAQLRTRVDRSLPILPRTPERFWDLAEATGTRMEHNPSLALALARRVVEQEPGCAGGWVTLAALSYWQLSREAAANDTESFHECEGIFLKAFALLPHYPRAVDDFCGFKTDLGNPRAALEKTFAALRKYPEVAHLRGALAYPARVSGLLAGAETALRTRDALIGSHRYERDTVENTHLYMGDWDRFERMLGPGSDHTVEPSRDFYRGYIRLVKGRPDQARIYFARAQKLKGSWVQFETLARIFELTLTDNREEALTLLRRFKADRSRVRVPDGEFTFKLAEAFAYLGDYNEATDTALRAYAQGFGCTRWYQESPFLVQVPRTPRWNSLMQHMKERQDLMDRSFPVERFGK